MQRQKGEGNKELQQIQDGINNMNDEKTDADKKEKIPLSTRNYIEVDFKTIKDMNPIRVTLLFTYLKHLMDNDLKNTRVARSDFARIFVEATGYNSFQYIRDNLGVLRSLVNRILVKQCKVEYLAIHLPTLLDWVKDQDTHLSKIL